jgi:hypothetical protein
VHRKENLEIRPQMSSLWLHHKIDYDWPITFRIKTLEFPKPQPHPLFMKRIALFALLVGFLSTSAIAQSSSVDSRLYAKFSTTEVAELEKDSPEIIAFWTYYLDHGYAVQAPSKKADVLEVVSMNTEDGEFNILALNLEPQENGNRYFEIKETGKLLVLYPYTQIRNELKEAK